MLVLVCLHASTDFYCIVPGLLLWVYDWIWRLRYSLVHKKEISVQDAGNGWLRIILPSADDVSEVERAAVSPLETYYINIPEISRLQNHPFTAAAVSAVTGSTTLILRKSPARKKAKSRDREWTWKLAALAEGSETEKVRQCVVSAASLGSYAH